jgi:PEP-CTERM motif
LLQNRDPGNSGNVNPADYSFWKSHFGTHLGSGSGAVAGGSVPEPSTMAILAFAVAIAYAGRRR